MTGHGHTNTGFAFGLVPASLCYTHLGWEYALLSFAICVLFSTAPDWLEVQIKRNVSVNKPDGSTHIEPRISTLIPHRTVTHIVSIWLFLGAIGINSIFPFEFQYNEYIPSIDNKVIVALLIGMSAGGLIHLVWDIPNKKPIPVFTLFDRISLGLWKSGRFEKPIVVVTLVISLIISTYILDPTTITRYYNQLMNGV